MATKWTFILSPLILKLNIKKKKSKKSKSKSKLIIRASLYHGPLPFLPTHISFASYTIIRCWTMLVDYVGLKIRLLGTSPMVYLAIFPWCKPKWSCDKFNNHSYVSLGQRHSPWCKQPMSFKGKKNVRFLGGKCKEIPIHQSMHFLNFVCKSYKGLKFYW